MVVSHEQMAFYKTVPIKMENDTKDADFNINDYINDVPLLVDDVTDDEDELESKRSVDERYRGSGSDVGSVGGGDGGDVRGGDVGERDGGRGAGASGAVASVASGAGASGHTSTGATTDFKQQRNQLMMVIVKYISIKITNLFPPSSSESKISLEKFLIIMINRLKLSLPNFLKGIIYLFRYMDIIYLLRYLNQSNNYANFNEMDFPLKKLIVGCFKLTLLRERIHKNWYKLTGLTDNEINIIIQSILKRLNNKIIIKPGEIGKLKLEIFRYVKVVSREV